MAQERTQDNAECFFNWVSSPPLHCSYLQCINFYLIQEPVLFTFFVAEALSSGQLEKKVPPPVSEGKIQGSPLDTQMLQPAALPSSSQRRISEPSMFESPRNIGSRAALGLLRTMQRQEARHQHSTDTTYSQPMGSDKYLYGVLYGCVLMLLYKHSWFLQLCPVPIFVYIVKHTGVCSSRKVLLATAFEA